MKLFKILMQIYSFFVIVMAFAVFIFPISMIALPLHINTRIKIVSPGWGYFAWVSMKLGIFAKITKIDLRDEEVKKKRQPEGLHIANHQSFMDIPLVLCSFQIPPIMKKEVLYIPIFGLCGYASGAMIVDRSKRDSRRRVFEQSKNRLLNEFKSLQYYPEGTRQRGSNEPKEFKDIKTPLMKFAYEADIPVYPTSIYGTKKILSAKTGMIRHGQSIGIKHHRALYPKDFETCEEFMQAAWNKVLEGYYELAEKIN